MIGDISWMLGKAIDKVTWLGPQNWVFHFTNGGSINAETSWRLIVAGRIRRTSADHGQWFGLPAPVDAEVELRTLLVGQKIQAAQLRDDTRDILISFDSGDRLEILPLSSGYESWHITTPSGEEVHAQGGGNLIPTILHK